MDIPRPEYPRPQFERDEWLCLNGEWQFEVDSGDSGLERGLLERDLSERILVPFCPESPLSGIGRTDFMEAVWYRREVEIPSEWRGKEILLHFQAVDYETTVWVNGVEAGRHRGGFTPFTCPLRGIAEPGDLAVIVVRARDPRRATKPGGKQSERYENHGCHYTRTTGIWQTVWLEPVSPVHLKRPRITPDLGSSCFHVELPVSENRSGHAIRLRLSYNAEKVVERTIEVSTDWSPLARLDLEEDSIHLWEPGNGRLYRLHIELLDPGGVVVDRVHSYAGLRSVTRESGVILINGVPVFQRQVLDQGYYPDGIMTAPTDEDLKQDIALAMYAGFNSARLHQKVFEERFLYHADRMGYMVWGEYGDWGVRSRLAANDPHYNQPFAALMTQWLEALERDYSHPCIVGWCGLNETALEREDRMQALDDLSRGMFLAAKAMDTTRPVLDSSGYSHRVPETDVWDEHDYTQDPQELGQHHAVLQEGRVWDRHEKLNVRYSGQPYFLSEFGGIKWNPAEASKNRTTSWGYGETPKMLEEFYRRFDEQCRVLLENSRLFGFCYTQLTDVYQEQNGIYFFDRTEKFAMDRIRAALTRPAALE